MEAGPARSDAIRGCTPGNSGTSTVSATAACSRPSSPPSHQVARSSSANVGGVSEREAFTDQHVNEEPGDPGTVGIFGDDGAEEQRQIKTGPSGQLGDDHHHSERRGGDETEQHPPRPVHLS